MATLTQALSRLETAILGFVGRRINQAMQSHLQSPDPHDQYLPKTVFNQHRTDDDPHSQYLKKTGSAANLKDLPSSALTGTIARERLPFGEGVSPTRRIIAGEGLVKGGQLDGDVTIEMGTPGTISASSSNSASGGTHTHAISSDVVSGLMSSLSVGSLGTYALLNHSGGSRYSPGDTRAGGLYYADCRGNTNGSASGSWRCMGHTHNSNTGEEDATTVWMRIA